MKLVRTLSSHQKYYLGCVANGSIVLVFHEDWNCYGEVSKWGSRLVSRSKTRGRGLMKSGGHFDSSIIELVQRGLLVDVNGRLVPSKEAAKEFGSPPVLAPPKREFKMSRTRAARSQAAT